MKTSNNIIMTDLAAAFAFLPMDLVMCILDYDRRFVIRKGQIAKIINQISPNDQRYDLLAKIPYKEFDQDDGLTFVYLTINDTTDYYLTYRNYNLQLLTFQWVDDNQITCLNAYDHNYNTDIRLWQDFLLGIEEEQPANP